MRAAANHNGGTSGSFPPSHAPEKYSSGGTRKPLAEGLRAQVEEQLAAEAPEKTAMPTYGTGVR